MSTDSPNSYRQRIYGNYLTARTTPLAPISISDLQSRLPYFRRLIRQHIPKNKGIEILELGCGHGTLVYTLRQEGYVRTHGIDGSVEQVEAANRMGIEGVIQGDVLDTLRRSTAGSLDCVIAFDIIEHLTKTELIVLVDEVMRVLRPGGRWIIHVPNGESPFMGKVLYSDFTHELAFTRTSLTQLLRSSGFRSVECFEDRPVAHGVKGLVRAILWRMIRAGWLLYAVVETGVADRRAIFSQNLLAVAVKDPLTPD